MPAPPLTVFKDAYTVASSLTRVLTQITVAAGDVVAVIGQCEDFQTVAVSSLAQTAGTATITTITKQQEAGTNSHAGNALFTFSVTSGGTLTLTATFTATPTNRASTFWTVVATGSGGIGVTAKTTTSTTTVTASLTTGANSAVAAFAADWAATGGATTTLTPSSPTPVVDAHEVDGVNDQVANGAKFSSRGGHWSDVGAGGTVSYGVSVPTSASYNLVAVEFLAGTAPVAAPAQPGQTWRRQFQHRQMPQAVPPSAGDQSIDLVDTGAGADALQVTADVPVSDTGTGADQISVAAAVSLTDTGTAVDSMVVRSPMGTPSILDSGGSTVDATSFTTASVSPSPSQLCLIYIDAGFTNTGAPTPTVSGAGLTFDLVDSINYKTGVGTNLTLFVFRAMSASPSSGAITIDFGAGNTVLGCRWDVITVPNTDTSGSNGAGSVVQSAKNSGAIAQNGSLSITLSAASDPTSREIAGFGLNNNAASQTPRTNWTELSDDAHSTPSQDLETQYRTDAFETTASSQNTAAGTLSMGGIALELLGAVVVAGSQSITLTDTGTGTDTLQVAADVPLPDTGAGSDQLSVNVAVTLTDSGSATDTLSVAAAVPLSDSGSGANTLSVAAAVPLTESGTGADTLAVGAAVTLTDTGSGTDTLNVTIPKTLTDSGSGSDSLAVAAAAPLAESGSGSDQLSVTAAVPLVDSGSATDTLNVVQGAQIQFQESGAGSDTLAVAATVPLVETGAGADSLAVNVAVTLTDSGSATDTLSVAQQKTLTDSGSAVDTMRVTAAVPLAESGQGVDTLRVAVLLSLLDSGSGVDVLSLIQISHQVRLSTSSRRGGGATSGTLRRAGPSVDDIRKGGGG